MAEFVAFLRGINVGGHKSVPMVKAKQIFEDLGFANVRTILASGNIIFEAKDTIVKLARIITNQLQDSFGFSIPVIVRPRADITRIVKADPFAGNSVTKDMRLYITFLPEEPLQVPRLPYHTPDNSFSVLALSDCMVFSVLDLSKNGTPEAMKILEKQFGKNITTRNWNTLVKIA
ncbi:MAG: DUF1697 domain-containing protein [Bacteroidota bacterium]|nr:DUF1697 domain-containing protein [Bacteroidota bacterium]MDP4230035.1 DUF1697 domain-containing protein [Bacteroidota bacterium]MDP4234844.1 DUF1697 domain-containing protein [Bacteroidota bacterium]